MFFTFGVFFFFFFFFLFFFFFFCLFVFCCCLFFYFAEFPDTEEVTKSGSLLPLGKTSLLSKIGDQRGDRNCYL